MENAAALAFAELQRSQAELNQQLRSNSWPKYEENTKVDITNMRKEAVVEALFNGGTPCGMGFMTHAADGDITNRYTRKSARNDLLEVMKQGKSLYFDYLHGVRMKLAISDDVVDIRRYNSGANEEGLGQRILADLKNNPTAFYATDAEMHADPIWQYCHQPTLYKLKTIMNYPSVICLCILSIFASIIFDILSM